MHVMTEIICQFYTHISAELCDEVIVCCLTVVKNFRQNLHALLKYQQKSQSVTFYVHLVCYEPR